MIGSIAYKAASLRLDGGRIAYKRNDGSIIYKADEAPLEYITILVAFNKTRSNVSSVFSRSWIGDYSMESCVGDYIRNSFAGIGYTLSFGGIDIPLLPYRTFGVLATYKKGSTLNLRVRLNYKWLSKDDNPVVYFDVVSFSRDSGYNIIESFNAYALSKYSAPTQEGSVAIENDPGFNISLPSKIGGGFSRSIYPGTVRDNRNDV